MVVSMKMFNTTVSSVKNKERQYNKLSEIDRFVRSEEFFTIEMCIRDRFYITLYIASLFFTIVWS